MEKNDPQRPTAEGLPAASATAELPPSLREGLPAAPAASATAELPPSLREGLPAAPAASATAELPPSLRGGRPATPAAPATAELPPSLRGGRPAAPAASATAELSLVSPMAAAPSPGTGAPPGTPESGPLGPGELVAGRIGVLHFFREGGQSWIYKAQTTDGASGETTPLALKLFKETIRPDDKITTALKLLRHPNIMPILEWGWHGTRYYQVMPWAEGGSLVDVLAGGNPLPPDALTQLVAAVAPILRFCHGNGIIHRDIKPQNFFYLDRERKNLVLADFGIASLMPQEQSLVEMQQRMATPGFGGPEAYSGRLGRESDYYGLGVTLLYLASGVSPFAGYDEDRILGVTLSERLPIPDSLPDSLKTLIRGLLVKERRDRWGFEEVERWLKGEAVPVVETATPGLAPAFLFEGVTFTERPALALAMAQRWDEAKKRLYRGQVREWAKLFDLDLANHMQDLEESERDQDRGVYRMLALLDPSGPYGYRSFFATDLASLRSSLALALAEPGSAGIMDVGLALRSGTVSEWLRRRGFTGEADRLEAVLASGELDNAYTYWRLYYALAPDEPLEIGSDRIETVQDLARYLAADWGNRCALAWEQRVQVWLEYRGLDPQVAAWLEAASEYSDARHRGLAVFISLIYPAGSSEPEITQGYVGYLQSRLRQVNGTLVSHVFRGPAAEQLRSEGQAVATVSPDGLLLQELIDLDLRTTTWLRSCRQKVVGVFQPRGVTGVLPLKIFRRHLERAREAASESLSILLSLGQSLSELGGSFPDIADLETRAKAAKTYEDYLAVVASAEKLVARTQADRQLAVEKAGPRGTPGQTRSASRAAGLEGRS
jgi:hypothetical protein